MNEEINSLVELYLERINAKEINIYAKKNLFQEIDKLYRDGFSLLNIQNAILQNPMDYKREIRLQRERSKYLKVQSETTDLLRGRFHFHPYTQESLGAPILYQNEDGTFTESYSQEKFKLAIKDRLTLNDILSYIYRRFPYVSRINSKDIGGMKYIYNGKLLPFVENMKDDISEVDILLFTIDAASAITEDMDIRYRNPLLELGHYLEDGVALYRDKVEICKTCELTYVQ